MKRIGFTLGEILIVLAMLGIIFMLTIPKLIQGTNQTELITAYKKAYQNICDEWNLAVNFSSPIGTEFDRLRAQVKTLYVCSPTNGLAITRCWSAGEVVDGTINSAYVDRAGMNWAQNTATTNHYVQVDVNGFSGPNLFGRDRFIFQISGARVIPLPDMPAATALCPKGNCKYTSWLDQ